MLRSPRRPSHVLVVLAALAAPLLIAGCGSDKSVSERLAEKATEKAIESGGGKDVDIDVDGDEVKIKSKDGDATFSNSTKLPEGWPDDIAMPDGTKLASATRINADGETMLNASGVVKGADAQQVADHFAAQFEGWKSVTNTNMGSGKDQVRGAVFQRGEDTANVAVTTTSGTDGASFTVGLQLK